MPFSQDEYAKATAIITFAVITKGIERTYPNRSMREEDDLFVSILDRMARMRGWELRRAQGLVEVEDSD